MEEDWRYEVQQYLCHGKVRVEPKRAREVKRRALRFTLLDGILYKRSFSRPLLKCLGPKEADYVLREVHEGCCAELMRSVVSPCPFDQWGFDIVGGIDIVGPFPISTGQRIFLLVAVDYFFKWAEAEPLAKITEGESNGQVEVTNRSIVHAHKARLDSARGKWVDELPSVLWAYRTTARTGTGETPNLVNGTEGVLPAEIGQENARMTGYGPNNDELRAMDLDLIEEKRNRADVRMAAYQKRMARGYNKRVWPRSFETGDLIMKKIQFQGERGKLDSKYEGPYKVIGKARIASYYLEDAEGKKTKCLGNVQHLKRYYA
ncbi:uncharacterized protein LOC142519741 [Primulina tabacum]|uniref:uncharacterized protein LOC142519741 n=1 Tax=Primulina tabacum TaxID=48773 RepID=UPI003F5A79F5